MARFPNQYLTARYVSSDERLNLFSTPAVSIRHRDMGNPDSAFNARVLYETACDVAAFRPDEGLPFTTDIAAPFYVDATVYAHATVHNGTAPYTYKWYTGPDPSHLTISSTSANPTYTLPATGDLYLTLVVQDVTGIYSFAHSVVHNCATCHSAVQIEFISDVYNTPRLAHPTNAISRFSLAPNPADGSVTVHTTLSDSDIQSGASVFILDASGRKVAMEGLTAANATTVIKTGDLPGGVYFVILQTGAIMQTQSILTQS